jgi:hypothetical protein
MPLWHLFARKLMVRLRMMPAIVVIVLLGLPGCSPAPSFKVQMQSEDPNIRAPACKKAGSSGDMSVAPLLVDRLEDNDKAVRFCAYQALRELTGQNFEYRDTDPPDLRAAAVKRWRDYVNSQAKNGGGRR